MRRPLLALLLVSAARLAVAQPLPVYDDQLRSGFADWSWGTHSLSQTAVVHSGTRAISFEPDGWTGLYLQRDAGIDLATYQSLELWVNGGASGGQNVRIAAIVANQLAGDAPLTQFLAGGRIPANQWVKATVPFASLGVPSGVLSGIWIQDGSGGNQGSLYVDDVQVLARTTPPPPPATVAVAVDPAADRHAVSPLIYGVNFGSAAQLNRLKFPVRRWGGNSTTRYSWQHDIANRASDWFFYNIEEANSTPGQLPNGSAVDRFVDEARAASSEPIVTVPTIGWTPIDRTRRWGFSVAKYGAQQQTECTATGGASWCNPDAGNGLKPNGQPITGNDPRDTSRAIGPDFVTAWMQHLAQRTGRASQGGVRLFALDNETELWNSTHRDVHPQPTTYDELWQRTKDYAGAIKAQDPFAEVLGPVVWGWCAYFGSAADSCMDGPDRQAHGGLPILQWYLRQAKLHQQQTGVKLVDWLDVHYYPQANGVTLSNDESAGTSALRLRTLRSLYDPTYTDESWIGQPVRLIPRMKEWIAAELPGTKLAITEYSFGNDDGPSSALAHAEALAIFGREGVDLATRWVAPADGSRVEDAFALFLKYDGQSGKVGSESVRATSGDPLVGAYGLRDATKLYVLLFNRDTTPRSANVTVAGGASTAALYRFDPATRLAAAGSVTPSSGVLGLTLPARSATLAVMALGTPPPPPPPPCTDPSATITAPGSVAKRSRSNPASVPDAGAGATYTWSITNGRIESGAGSRSIRFKVQDLTPVTLGVTVTRPGGCRATGTAIVAVR